MGVQTDRYLEALDHIQKDVEKRERSWRGGGHPHDELKAAECSAILVVIENLRYQHTGVPHLTELETFLTKLEHRVTTLEIAFTEIRREGVSGGDR